MLLSVAVALFCLPTFGPACPAAHAKWRNPEKTLSESRETYATSTLTRDSDGFFSSLSASGHATFATKISLSDLAKIGISSETGKLSESGGGSYKSPAKSGSTNGANFSYDRLCTITVDDSVFQQAAQLTYVNNNGVTVSYNKRDCIQAVLYAIGETTQAAGFDGKTIYQVNVDYDGTIELTNGLFVYSNTWLKLGANTTLVKQFQSPEVESALPDRVDAANRQIDYSNENLLRCGAGEYDAGGYGQFREIIIDGGTWDANLAQYNRAKLGDGYQSSLATFTHMKNLVVQNATMLGANLAHHLELSGVRDVTVANCRFAQDDGAYANEAIQIETLHSRGATRESAPYDDTLSRDVVVYANSFEDLSRGVGNHATVLGRDPSRIFVYQNTFENIASQAVLVCGCRDTRVEGNSMKNVGCGVDVRMTWEDGPLNLSVPHDEGWTYKELVDEGALNRDVKIVGNSIAVGVSDEADPVESTGIGVFVKGQTLEKADLGSLGKAAGTYTLTGITVRGNDISGAVGKAVSLDQTQGLLVSGNKVSGIALSALHADGIYANNSSALSISGNTITTASGWGVYLARESPDASIAKNVISASAGKPAVRASKTCQPREVSGNRLTVTGPYALEAAQNIVAVTLGKKTAKKVSGTSASSVKLSAYAGKKSVGTTQTGAKGKFTIKFKKKLKATTALELRYTDGAKNSVRFGFRL